MKVCRNTRLLYTLALVFALSLAWPGRTLAHGQGGDHADQASGANNASSAAPRFEAVTDVFELVAALAGGELAILIDRFETNAPVLDARVEVESGGRKAVARFRADHGDYAVDDPAVLAVLSQPGEHAVVIAVVAGESSDLLNGTLAVTGVATGHAHGDGDHGHELERVLIIGAGVVFALLLVVLWRRRRRPGASLQGVRS